MTNRVLRLLCTGLVLSAAGCAEDTRTDLRETQDEREDENPARVDVDGELPDDDEQRADLPEPDNQEPHPVETPQEPDVPAEAILAKLAAAEDCSDLLTRVQDDAIAKLKMQVELAKKQPPAGSKGGPGGLDVGAGFVDEDDGDAPPRPDAEPQAPSRDGASADGESSAKDGDKGSAAAPVGASDTNRQVDEVDEADFVKVVENGAGIFLLHGHQLFKLKSWPAAETALTGMPLEIEGTPSEMFVTESGKAVIFSSVWGYGENGGGGVRPGGPVFADGACFIGSCGGGGNTLKITVADVSGSAPKTERELYYEGAYVSSRRYEGDIVRTVVQASSKFHGLFQPNIMWYDAWGRPFDEATIAQQLDEWQTRTIASIRNTTLEDWLPTAHEAKGDALVEVERDCDAYFVPEAGLAGYGLTHVLSLDPNDAMQPVGGVTILGATSTVYSNAENLVLAQPDYRTLGTDFGITDEQQTALHAFALAGAETTYTASGWVFGHLPRHNPQFGIDVAEDGTIRVATTGSVRSEPDAEPGEAEFWRRTTENYVSTLQRTGAQLRVVGKSVKLGKPDEMVQSARFIGDRAYVVTFRQIDPLVVVDVSTPSSLPVLGEIEIPGFSQYIHPLDEHHLVTLGQSADRGIQLQLFDVTNPASIPPPKTLDFGSGTYSEGSYNHKAFTLFEGVLAIPLSGRWASSGRVSYGSALELVRVDAQAGFTYLGAIDHAPLYADNGAGERCGVCDVRGCFDYACGYAPEVRRGHFVKGEEQTYVYSFSYAGVLVHDLAALQQPVARVGLPAPRFDQPAPWYADRSAPDPTTGGAADAGVAVTVDGSAATDEADRADDSLAPAP